MRSMLVGGVAAALVALAGSAWAHSEPGSSAPKATSPNTPGNAPDVTRARCEAAADYSAAHSGRVVLVMQHGKVVFERADNGWTLERPHALASGSKSFTGVMAMLAVQDGLLTLDERAADTITEWKGDANKSQITVRHLLTLSSGLEPSDRAFTTKAGSGGSVLGEGAAKRGERISKQKTTPEGEANTRGLRPENNFKTAVSVPSECAPGTKFHYGPSHFFAFGELLQRKLQAAAGPQKTVMAYLEERIFQPMGVEGALIGRDQAGNPNLPGGFLLPARSWAAFGQFVLQNGSVRGADGALTQILKADLLAQCFEPSANNPQYGLTWWLYTSGQRNPEASLVADGGGLLGGGAQGGGAQGGGAQGDDAGGEGGPIRQRLRERLKDRMAERAKERAGESGGAGGAKPAVSGEVIVGPDGKPVRVMMAAGLGKQRLYVLPQFDLVVVRFAEATREGMSYDDREFLRLLLQGE